MSSWLEPSVKSFRSLAAVFLVRFTFGVVATETTPHILMKITPESLYFIYFFTIYHSLVKKSHKIMSQSFAHEWKSVPDYRPNRNRGFQTRPSETRTSKKTSSHRRQEKKFLQKGRVWVEGARPGQFGTEREFTSTQQRGLRSYPIVAKWRYFEFRNTVWASPLSGDGRRTRNKKFPAQRPT